MTSVVHIYPNGEFTAGQDTSRKRRLTRYERVCTELHTGNQAPAYQEEYKQKIIKLTPDKVPVGVSLQSPLGTIFVYKEKLHGGGIRIEGVNKFGERIEIIDKRTIAVFMRDEQYTLVHQTVEFSHKPENGRKVCPKMTSRMGRNIRNASYILEQDYGKNRLSFLTLTLPALSQENLRKCHENWSKMVDQFFKWMASKIGRQNGRFLYTYCTEIQTKRLAQRGEYALHLHLLFVGRGCRKGSWYVTPMQCRRAWTRCLKRVCNEHFETKALENLQRIRRSAGAYLSKYMSKGKSGYAADGLPEDAGTIPIHWGGMSREISREIRRRSRKFRGDGSQPEIANSISASLFSVNKHRAIKFVKTAFIEFPGRDGTRSGRGIWVAAGCLHSGLHTSILTDMIADLLSMRCGIAYVDSLR